MGRFGVRAERSAGEGGCRAEAAGRRSAAKTANRTEHFNFSGRSGELLQALAARAEQMAVIIYAAWLSERESGAALRRVVKAWLVCMSAESKPTWSSS